MERLEDQAAHRARDRECSWLPDIEQSETAVVMLF